MARLKEYDPEFVLDAAMNTFWSKGYEGTSIRDLAKACKLTTRSMYNAYPDKDRFFEAALDHYHQKVLSPIIQILENGHGYSALTQFVNLLGREATVDGCLFLNTSASRHLVGLLAVKKVDKYINRLRTAIHNKLEEEKVSGKFKGNSDLRSDQIVAAVMGFVLSLKAGVPRKNASAVLNQVIVDIQST